jgi:hypothetical protein
MKTWKIEMIVVAAILLTVNFFTQKLFTIEMLAATAVLLTFGHIQISERLAEKEAQKSFPEVECYRKLHYYFIAKELFWLAYFFMNHSYSALVGVFTFLAYPIWRKYWRKYHPL